MMEYWTPMGWQENINGLFHVRDSPTEVVPGKSV